MQQKGIGKLLVLATYVAVAFIAVFASALFFWRNPTSVFLILAVTGAVFVVVSGRMGANGKTLAHDLFLIAAYASLCAGLAIGMVASR